MDDRHSTARLRPAEAEYYNLGSYHRRITTASNDAQIWFNRGLIWTYAFNHDEAAVCFTQAIAHDSSCAMAYWGLSYALGPNYNKPWEVFDDQELEKTLKEVWHAAQQAKNLCSEATQVEKAFIEAVQSRYPQDTARRDWSTWNKAYADAMKSVYEQFPEDLDVAAIYSDALMNLKPWSLWDITSGAPVEGAPTLEVKTILDQALLQENALQHPGLLHLYIHLMEMSPIPEAALTIADNLRGLVPDAGHLAHMPSHLDVLCGDYRRAMASNEEAIRADNRFFSSAIRPIFYALYRCHNLHFRIYAAMLCGQSQIALQTVTHLEAAVPEELLRIESPPMADWLEGFLSMRVHVLVRFGRWEEILTLRLPDDQNLYCATVSMIHYGKAIALANSETGLKEAEEERKLFRTAVRRVLPTRTLFNNTCKDILNIAEAMLDAELEYRRGNRDVAFGHFKEAIARDDALPYDEPWGWMQPTRHAYGALLLEQGRVSEAAAVYSADLGMDSSLPRALQHPNNVWALHGYHEALTRMGRTAEAKILKPQLRMALAVTDVPVESSCFCRQTARSSEE